MTYGAYHKTKRRSKQKNLKKDTRPENLRPGGADYVAPEDRPGYVPPPPKEVAPKEEGAAGIRLEDLALNCRDCSGEFLFTGREQKTYKKQGFDSFPSRCTPCRELKRNAGPASGKEVSVSKKATPKRKKDADDVDTTQEPKKLKPEKLKTEKKCKIKIKKAALEAMEQDVGNDSEHRSSDSDDAVEELPIQRDSGSKGEDEQAAANVGEVVVEADGSDDEKESEGSEGEVEEEEEGAEEEVEEEEEEEGKEEEVEEEEGYEGKWGEGWDGDSSAPYSWNDERDDALLGSNLESFDLYAALELPKDAIVTSDDSGRVRGGVARLRAQYHRLSMRYHPDTFVPKRSGNATAVETQRQVALLYFRRVAVAFEALKDPERAAVYCKHGFEGLKKSEDTYASASVLESVKPFARFDAFFEGTDPDDRQYLLLEAASGGHFSDEEKAVHKRGELTEDERPTNEAEDEDEEEEDDDEFFAIAAAAAQVKKPTEVGERAAAATLPRPPPGVGAALLLKASPSVSMSPPGGRLDDPFARVASSFRNSKQEGSQ